MMYQLGMTRPICFDILAQSHRAGDPHIFPNTILFRHSLVKNLEGPRFLPNNAHKVSNVNYLKTKLVKASPKRHWS